MDETEEETDFRAALVHLERMEVGGEIQLYEACFGPEPRRRDGPNLGQIIQLTVELVHESEVFLIGRLVRSVIHDPMRFDSSSYMPP